MTDCIQVVTTVDTRENADKIARCLLDCRLAGCVQVDGPIASSYWWQGKVETAEEWRCVIKTTAARYAEVEREIRAAHPYEEPEILAVRAVAGSVTYLAWLADSVRSAE